VLARKRVVFVALKKGLLGQESSGLIGSLVISSLWQATLRRANIPQNQRRPAWLYVDEFQDVVRLPLDVADMLAQARGLGLGVTVAHQYLGQLTPEMKNAVIGATRTHLVFQLGYSDARELATSFTPLTAEDLKILVPMKLPYVPAWAERPSARSPDARFRPPRPLSTVMPSPTTATTTTAPQPTRQNSR
jgi:hypothetical protein